MLSAIFAFCSTMKIVVPWRLISWITSKTWSTKCGASPIDGSSMHSSLGRPISARPIASICCSPPDIVPASCLRRSFIRGKQTVDPVEVHAHSGVIAPAGERTHLQVFDHGHARKHPTRFRHHRHTSGDDLAGIQPVDALAVEDDVPSLGLTIPRIVFIVVDLPEALPPSRQTISPSYSS